jgi:hypothetical protein
VVVVSLVLVLVVAVLVVGPWRSDDDGDAVGDLPPLPAPAVEGLHLEAEVRLGDDEDAELVVETTLSVDDGADGVVVLPDASTADMVEVDWHVLARRSRGPDGGIVLATGRGSPEDPRARPHNDTLPPRTLAFTPWVGPGQTVTGSGRTTPWPADPEDPAEAVSVDDVARAREVRVCVWGHVTSLRAAMTGTDFPSSRLVCVDVPGPGR